MLTVIAMQEDAKKYKGAVTYWNEQLMPLCGFGGRTRLVLARDKSIASGWLHYEAGARSKPGKYWTTIPVQYEDLPDGAMDESSCTFYRTEMGQNEDVIPSQNGTQTRTESGRNTCAIQDGIPAPSLPIPIPNPDPKYIHVCFGEWYEVYPRKVAKDDAEKKFAKALSAIATKRRLTLPEAAAWLIERTMQFAESDKAKGEFCPHPATWLNQGRYNDDPKEWVKRGSRNGKLSYGDGQVNPNEPRKPIGKL